MRLSTAALTPRKAAKLLRRHCCAAVGKAKWVDVLLDPQDGTSIHRLISLLPAGILQALGPPTWNALLRSPERDWRLYWARRLSQLRQAGLLDR